MTEIKTVKERLKEFINYIGINQHKFETCCGLSNGYVNNIRVSIQPKTLQRIALSFPNLNQAWLLTGEGEMLKNAPGGDCDSGDNVESSRNVNVTDLQHFRDLLTEKFNGLNIYKQKDMAEYLGYNEATFSQIWNGRCGISDRLLLRLKRRLSLDLSGCAFDERKDLFGIPPRGEEAEKERKRGVMEVPEEVWDVLKEQSRTLAVQSESLAVRDRQVDELIGIIKKREGADVSDARTDAAACADAG